METGSGCVHAVVISLAETQLLQILSSRRHNLFKLLCLFVAMYESVGVGINKLKSRPVLNLSEGVY